MRAAFVLGTVMLALVLALVGAVSGSRLVGAIVTIGLLPILRGASHLIERLTGCDLWRLSAPYPYRWLRED